MIALKSAQRLPRGLNVEWIDGMRAQFSNVWLRDNSFHMRPALIHLDLNPCPQVPSVVTVETRYNDARLSLVDAIAALKRLHDEHPLYFRFMMANPIEYEHAFFKATHHLANVEGNEIVSAVFNNDFRSSQMTTDNLDLFYRSLKTFYNICCEMQQEVYINSDELLVADNSQVLIGAPAQWGREMRVRIFA
ncbi:unnamed protein product [Heligmosomoides polygyrus]|uniref:EAL domain-containing protein n=1 Tax=Heligmosomoides polygyrus TaxID=6339 RepID=A0A3P7WK19_HELPZ|nr:unnamed protein product [Heligmosomoides polygyrus]